MVIAEKALYRGSEATGSPTLDARSLLVARGLDGIPKDGQWDLLTTFMVVRQEGLAWHDPRFQAVSKRLDSLSKEEQARLRPCIDAIRDATTGNNQDNKERKRMVERNLAIPGEGSLTGKTDSI